MSLYLSWVALLLCLLLVSSFHGLLGRGRKGAVGGVPTSSKSRLGVSAAPYLNDLNRAFGDNNKTNELLMASKLVVYAIVEEALKENAEKDKALAAEKDKALAEKDKALAEKDKSAALNYTLSQKEYSLFNSVTENLRLKGKLDVRGMIEEIELQLSPGKFGDPNTSRTKLWAAARQDPRYGALFEQLAACFPSRGETAKEAAISTIKSVYKKASEMIHTHIGSNNVVIILRHRDFPGDDEQRVIRVLAEYFHFKLEEEPLPT
jgi:hypothetical protein